MLMCKVCLNGKLDFNLYILKTVKQITPSGRQNTVKMIDEEILKIISIILTLVVRAESDFIGELQVSIQNLQDAVDKISLENAKTIEKVDKLQSDITLMKEANSRSFENVDEKLDQFDEKFSSTSLSISSLNKMIQTIEGKIEAGNNRTLDEMENQFQSLSLKLNSSIADFNDKFSTLETNFIKGNNAVIQKVSKIDLEKLWEGQIESFENVTQLQNELKTLHLNMNSMLENVCNDSLVAINSKVTALSRSGGCSNNVIG